MTTYESEEEYEEEEEEETVSIMEISIAEPTIDEIDSEPFSQVEVHTHLNDTLTFFSSLRFSLLETFIR